MSSNKKSVTQFFIFSMVILASSIIVFIIFLFSLFDSTEKNSVSLFDSTEKNSVFDKDFVESQYVSDGEYDEPDIYCFEVEDKKLWVELSVFPIVTNSNRYIEIANYEKSEYSLGYKVVRNDNGGSVDELLYENGEDLLLAGKSSRFDIYESLKIGVNDDLSLILCCYDVNTGKVVEEIVVENFAITKKR